MTLIDTHAHINYLDYAERINEIIQAATDKGVKKIISVGTDLKTSEECIKLAEKYDSVYATCGIHPHEAKKHKAYKLSKEIGEQNIKMNSIPEKTIGDLKSYDDMKSSINLKL